MTKDVPDETAEILLSSLAEGTIKQYSSSLKNWQDFCMKNYPASFQNSTKKFLLKFLTQPYKQGASYGTLNTDRSAISLIFENKVGDDPEVSQFFKGISRLKLFKPKYSFTWDTNVVLNYIKNLKFQRNNQLSQLSTKLIMLLALGTAQRAQTVASIVIDNIRFNDQGVTIPIDKVLKTSLVNKTPTVLSLPFFNKNTNICIVICLKD